jgi:hypothetical protein
MKSLDEGNAERVLESDRGVRGQPFMRMYDVDFFSTLFVIVNDVRRFVLNPYRSCHGIT